MCCSCNRIYTNQTDLAIMQILSIDGFLPSKPVPLLVGILGGERVGAPGLSVGVDLGEGADGVCGDVEVAVEEVDVVVVSGWEEVASSYEESVGAAREDDITGEDAIGVDVSEGEVQAEGHLVERFCFGAGEFPVEGLSGSGGFRFVEFSAEVAYAVGRVDRFIDGVVIGFEVGGNEGPAIVPEVICGECEGVCFPCLIEVEGGELFEV